LRIFYVHNHPNPDHPVLTPKKPSDTDQPADSHRKKTARPAPTPPSSGSIFKKKPSAKTTSESGPDFASGRTDRKKNFAGKTSSRKGESSGDDDFLPAKEGRRAYNKLKTEQTGTYDEPRKKPLKTKRPAGLPPKRIDKNSPEKAEFTAKTISDTDDSYRLNKYIANSGVCSRREADTLIAEGKVAINGTVVTELGTKVSRKDVVTVEGATVNPVDFVYILLNKPKNYITTTDDEKGRNTVMDLVEDGTGHRLYPVGRLDRQTTGLLLLTNDGDLAHRLMHPKYKVRKVYEIMTPEPVSDEQLRTLAAGVTLEDGPAIPHRVQRVPGSETVIQVTVLEGRNHLVRRMMEAIGYPSIELARITYGGLHIRGLRNGRWRYLRPNEVNDLRKLVKLFNLDMKESDSKYKRGKR